MDHILPIMSLLIEYVITNPVFVKRHIFIIVALGFIYLIFNFSYSVAGYPPYDMTDWKSVKGCIMPFVCINLGNLLYVFLEFCNRKKLGMQK